MLTTILIFTFIFSLIFGGATTIVFRKKLPLVILSVSCILITGISLFFIGNSKIEQNHRDEINSVITKKGGVVKSIELIENSKLTPFDKQSDSRNIIYKIKYLLGDQNYIAWYRGIKVVNNIHAQPQNRYGEKWVFDTK